MRCTLKFARGAPPSEAAIPNESFPPTGTYCPSAVYSPDLKIINGGVESSVSFSHEASKNENRAKSNKYRCVSFKIA